MLQQQKEATSAIIIQTGVECIPMCGRVRGWSPTFSKRLLATSICHFNRNCCTYITASSVASSCCTPLCERVGYHVLCGDVCVLCASSITACRGWLARRAYQHHVSLQRQREESAAVVIQTGIDSSDCKQDATLVCKFVNRGMSAHDFLLL